MKLMIDIPDEAYELLKSKSELDNIAESIIANGTPISNEGDLISRSALKEKIPTIEDEYKYIHNVIDSMPNYGGEVVPDTLQGWRYEEKPQGKWITFPTNHLIMQCPECTILLSRTRSDIFKDSIGEINFCPNCGTYNE